MAWLMIVFGRSSETYKNGNDATVPSSNSICSLRLYLRMNWNIVGSISLAFLSRRGFPDMQSQCQQERATA